MGVCGVAEQPRMWNWAALMFKLEKQKAHDFDPHPKLEKLVVLALKHPVDVDADAIAAREEEMLQMIVSSWTLFS